MKERQTQVQFCPKCGSTNITFAVFYRPSIWKCLDCGYEGALIIGDSPMAQKIREKSVPALTECEVEASEFPHPGLTWPMPPRS
jgi:DNA-directed RNA polymerase subunit M